VQAADNARLNELLNRAKARKNSIRQKIQTEESGYLPAETSRTKEVQTTQLESVPKQKPYNELVDQFNELFDETKTNIEEHKETKKVTTIREEPIIKREAPKKIIKTTAKTQPAATKAPAAVTKSTSKIQVETQKQVTQSTVQTTTKTQSQIKKAEPKVVEDIHVEEEELDEDEFEEFEENEDIDEDDEENELDEDEGLVEEKEEEVDMPDEKRVISKNLIDPKTQAERVALYLEIVKKSLKSLEEDPWNEVRYNMNESVKYFEKEKSLYNSGPIDKFHKITLAFLRFAEGGLELDQGDFADFEDAEAHYLDSQDILDAVELQLKSKDKTDQALLEIIQNVKKYINEDIEYIEEMIDLS
jgi:hypothetical protein